MKLRNSKKNDKNRKAKMVRFPLDVAERIEQYQRIDRRPMFSHEVIALCEEAMNKREQTA